MGRFSFFYFAARYPPFFKSSIAAYMDEIVV